MKQQGDLESCAKLWKFWRHPLAEKFRDAFANVFFVWDLLINKKLGNIGN